MAGSVVNRSADVDGPRSSAWRWSGRRDVEGEHVAELHAVARRQPLEAQRAGRALGWTAEGQVGRDGGEVAEPLQVQSLGGRPGDDEGVRVLRRRRVERREVTVGRRLLERMVGVRGRPPWR